MKTIELLNSEGPILIVSKVVDPRFIGTKVVSYVLTDQYKIPLGTLNKIELESFLRGDISIFNSKNKEIKYNSYPDSMKPSKSEIELFLNN